MNFQSGISVQRFSHRELNFGYGSTTLLNLRYISSSKLLCRYIELEFNNNCKCISNVNVDCNVYNDVIDFGSRRRDYYGDIGVFSDVNADSKQEANGRKDKAREMKRDEGDETERKQERSRDSEREVTLQQTSHIDTLINEHFARDLAKADLVGKSISSLMISLQELLNMLYIMNVNIDYHLFSSLKTIEEGCTLYRSNCQLNKVYKAIQVDKSSRGNIEYELPATTRSLFSPGSGQEEPKW
ncbi:hypothetical protein ALC53_04784 [Atta colombica]|uniref:Uncharacterized protein n=1 Tax=Atta colombica TaxID=520822 RepID=A0A195BIS6_9HYME|nr:hypothetical protein ALC53_04784 [Atta colombica]